MSAAAAEFDPCPSLLPGEAVAPCRACVTIPVRNEESTLARCLHALNGQQTSSGRPLPAESFEVILLLNNCTDASAQVAATLLKSYPALRVHVIERELPVGAAHVGTARRWLMDTAWHRLHVREARSAILSTDADTVVAPDWITANLRALAHGADVVGGQVHLLREESAQLPGPVSWRYEQDRRYARLVAQLEHQLDPLPWDPWPRHLDHFGSSLACTPQAYAKAGGLPPVSPLEDEAFVDSVRRANLRLRHEPTVKVYTSARLHGRASVGLAGQLRLWAALTTDETHQVASAALLQHRFQTLRRLRTIFESKCTGDLDLPTGWWRETFATALHTEDTYPGFLAAIYCDVLIRESFSGASEEPIAQAIRGLEARLEVAQPYALVPTR